MDAKREAVGHPDTPFAKKRNLSRKMAKEYNPSAVEKSVIEFWDKSGFFQAEAKSAFPIVLPPPNVTIGHALTASTQDTLIRWKRMSGHNTLWVPGMVLPHEAAQDRSMRTRMEGEVEARVY